MPTFKILTRVECLHARVYLTDVSRRASVATVKEIERG